MCAFELDSNKCDNREKMAERLALAAGFSSACIGVLDCSKRNFVDAWIGCGNGDPQMDKAQVLDVVARALATSLALGQHDPVLAPEHNNDESETWLWSSRYLIGIGERVGDLAPVAALVNNGSRKEISSQQRSLAHIGLTYAEQLRQEQFGIAGQDGRNQLPEVILRSLSFGFAVTDANGCLSYMTDLAKDWLEENNELHVANGRLTAANPQNQKLLMDALTVATDALGKRKSVVHLGGTDDLPRTIVVLPIGRKPSLALVVFGQAQGDEVLRDRLLMALGLTVAERRLAQQLLAGKSLSDAAAENNLTISTARSYLKRVFAKTGVHRQSQLITLYHTLIPPVLADTEQ